MKKFSWSESELDRIEHQAASWVLRRDRGLTAAEQDEFCQWLTTDSRNRRCFARHARNWDRLDNLTEWRPEHSLRPNPDLLAVRARRIRLALPLSLAAAAVFAVYLRWALPVAQFAASPPAAPIALIEERTLADGSTIQLNRGSAITVDISPSERLVHLVSGEAHFKVAKNPAWPFVVDAGGIRVRAVGTAFDVSLGAAAVAVLVTEGRVRIDSPSKLGDVAARAGVSARFMPAPAVPMLEAGQRAVVSISPSAAPPEVTTVSPEKMGELLIWRPRLLDFTAVPLSKIVREFNRHNLVQLKVLEGELADLPISASFRSDNIEGFVSLLQSSFGVRAERRESNEIVLSKLH